MADKSFHEEYKGVFRHGWEREVVEDWAEHPIDVDAMAPWQIGELLGQSFPGQPFPRRFFSDDDGEPFSAPAQAVRYHDESGCMLSEDGKTLVACVDPQPKVHVPGSVEAIGPRAFSGCDVHEVLLPEGLRSIGPYAFHCSAIRDIELPGNLQSIGIGAFGWTFPKYLDDYYLMPDGPTRLRMGEGTGPFEIVDDYLIGRVGGEVRLLSCYYPYWYTDRRDSKRRSLGYFKDPVFEPGAILFAPPEGVTRLMTDCITLPSSCMYQLDIRLPRSLTTIDEYAVRDGSVRSVNVPQKLVNVAHDFWRYVAEDMPYIYERHHYTRADGSRSFTFGGPLDHFPLSRYRRVSVHRKNPRYYVYAGEFHIRPPVE